MGWERDIDGGEGDDGQTVLADRKIFRKIRGELAEVVWAPILE